MRSHPSMPVQLTSLENEDSDEFYRAQGRAVYDSRLQHKNTNNYIAIIDCYDKAIYYYSRIKQPTINDINNIAILQLNAAYKYFNHGYPVTTIQRAKQSVEFLNCCAMKDEESHRIHIKSCRLLSRAYSSVGKFEDAATQFRHYWEMKREYGIPLDVEDCREAAECFDNLADQYFNDYSSAVDESLQIRCNVNEAMAIQQAFNFLSLIPQKELTEDDRMALSYYIPRVLKAIQYINGINSSHHHGVNHCTLERVMEISKQIEKLRNIDALELVVKVEVGADKKRSSFKKKNDENAYCDPNPKHSRRVTFFSHPIIVELEDTDKPELDEDCDNESPRLSS